MLGMSTDEQTGENEDQVKSLVLENRTITIKDANMLTVSSGSIGRILKDNKNIHQFAAKFVPHLLSEERVFWVKNKMIVIPHPPYALH
jgi:hypothetical protein